ncbi:pyrimidine-nucleoside phosphorylase, partial [Paenibacillus validus]|nr:pyrimidine-nucleoside phosphorylase [Paenibacillus validus]
AESLGVTAMMLGAGRATKEDRIDLAVGIKLFKRVGDRVKAGEPIAELYMNRSEPEETRRMSERTVSAFAFSEAPVDRLKLIYAVVTKDGVRYL